MRNEDRADLYWVIVRRCLTDLLAISTGAAEERITSLRAMVDRGIRRRLPLFYHAEPFYVAYDLLKPEEIEALSDTDTQPTADDILSRCADEYARIRDHEPPAVSTAATNGQPSAVRSSRQRRPASS